MSKELVPVFVVTTNLGISEITCQTWEEVAYFLKDNVLTSEIDHEDGDDIQITVSLRKYTQERVNALGEWEP
jgi:hypothetical protein